MNVTYRIRWLSCGKKKCRKCPHGPYWYATYYEGGKMRSKYVGKVHPSDAAKGITHTKRDPNDDIFVKSKRNLGVARRILWLPKDFTKEVLEQAYKDRMEFYSGSARTDPHKRKQCREAYRFIKSGSYWSWW